VATTADKLLEKVLDRCFWPLTDGEAPLTHAKILGLADDVIVGDMWPEIIASHGDYGINRLDYDVTTDQARYALPADAYGPIRTVTLVDDEDDTNELDVPAINLSDIGRFRELPQSPSGFYHYIDGDFAVLYPKPSDTENTLRIRFYRHPLKLCKTIAAAVVTELEQTVVAGNTVLVVHMEAADSTSSTDVPASWVETTDVLGFVRAGNAHQLAFEGATFSIDLINDWILLSPADTALVLASDAAVGDYLGVNGTSCLVQVPDHMMSMCITKVAEECLRAHKDTAAAEEQRARGEKLERLAKSTSIPRSQADSGILVSRNSPLRSGRMGGGWMR
jgi:hypothetical protein